MMSPWLASGTVTTSSLTGSSRIGIRLGERVAQPHRRRGLERHLGAVDGVVLAVEAGDLHVDDGEAERAAVLFGFGDALLDRGQEVASGSHRRRSRRRTRCPRRAPCGSTRSHAIANWPWPPVCFLSLPSASARAGDGLAVRDAHLFGVDLDAELARQLLERDREMRLAHARGARSGASRDCARCATPRSSSSRRCSAFASLSSSPFERALIATASTGAGGSTVSHVDGRALRREHVAGAGIGELRDRGDVARGDLGHRCPAPCRA